MLANRHGSCYCSFSALNVAPRDDSPVRASNVVSSASTNPDVLDPRAPAHVAWSPPSDRSLGLDPSSLAIAAWPLSVVAPALFVKALVAGQANRVGILPGHFQSGCFPQDCWGCRRIWTNRSFSHISDNELLFVFMVSMLHEKT